ncbi:DUF222 domain-containing protein [Dermacoccaceae bacterium W4C1]
MAIQPDGMSVVGGVRHAGADEVAAALAAVPDLVHDADLLTDAELTHATRDVLALMATCEAAVIGLAAHAIARGVVSESNAASPAQWLSRLATGATHQELAPGVGRAGALVRYDEPADGQTHGADAVSAEDVGARLADAGEPSASTHGTDGPARPLNSRSPGFPGLEPAHARRLANLADATRLPRHRVLRSALTSATVTSASAATALRHVDKLAAVLPSATHDDIHGWFLTLDPAAGAGEVRELTRRLTHRYGPPDELDRSEATLTQHERLSFATMPCGMTQLVAELSPDHAALVRNAVEALAAPSPPSDCCDDPHHRHRDGATVLGPDPRTPGRRRADALVEIVTAATRFIDDDASVVTSGAARLIVTLNYDDLAAAVTRTRGGASRGGAADGDRAVRGGRSNHDAHSAVIDDRDDRDGSGHDAAKVGTIAAEHVAGLGVTDLGVSLAPSTIRRLACDAEIIPMVLGSPSAPLDVGRSRRLVTGELRRAVIQRDRHCTFPGCDRPPPWCHVHHLIPWQHGGVTSLRNSALLCSRHHTLVHQHGYAAVHDGEQIVWDLHRNARWLAATSLPRSAGSTPPTPAAS